jgi:SAM-dependent methyltransferase
MSLEGPAFYDDDAVFAEYMSHRRWVDNPNNTLEYPVMIELAGELANLRILDLGCGDAAWGREALAKGCRSYLGVEGSRNMVAAARRQLEDTSGEIAHASIETWDYPHGAFDLVVSRLALHYLQDVKAVFALVYDSLAPAGRFVFSIEHPVITSCDRGWQSGPRQAWLVDDYFETGQRETAWLGGKVIKYHRTVEDYFGGLQRAGFVVESLRESRPERRWFQDEATFQRRKRIPLFLFLAAAKRTEP